MDAGSTPGGPAGGAWGRDPGPGPGPGGSETEPPFGDQPPPVRRRSSVPWGWVVLVTVLAMAVSVAVLVLPDVVGRTLDDDEEATRRVRPVSAWLLDGLRNERALAMVDILGIRSALSRPTEDTPHARQATDEALVAFGTTISDAGDELEAHYEGAIEALADLSELRTEIDSRIPPGDVTQAPYAAEVFDRYDEIIGGLEDADVRFLRATIDDPEVRRGADLLAESRPSLDATERLLLAIAATGGLMDSPEAVATTSSIRADLESGRSAVAGLAADTVYEAAADELDATLAEAGLEDILDEALATRRLDMPGVVPAIGPSSGAWKTFVNAVDARLDQELRDS